MKRWLGPTAGFLIALGAAGCSSEPQERSATQPAPKPQPLYALSEGVPVFRSPIGLRDEPLRRMQFGEIVKGMCDDTTCRFSENGVAVEVAKGRVRGLALPPRVQ